MKELSIEEKAERYDEAIKVATDIKTGNATYIKDGTLVIDAVFPELAESEDERIRKWLIHYFTEVCDNVSEKEKKGILAWLEKQGEQKSIEVRTTGYWNVQDIEQKPAEWSEEDEKMLNDILMCGEHHCYLDAGNIAWLKSLKDRYTWKPSEEQIDALHYVTNFDYGGHKATLVSLYEQLKKL